MTVRVLPFARIREIVGAATLARGVPDGATAGDVWAALVRDFPGLAELSASTRLVRNGALVARDVALADADELALLPPFGGGQRRRVSFEISAAPLDLAAVVASVVDESAGGLVTFVGYVRASSDDGRPVDGLSYEAHEDLALAELRAIGAEAIARFGPLRIAIAHRTGSLGLGEAAVAIAVAAPHRAEAFDACEFAIDALKSRVAIWKKEHYVGGRADWRENPVSQA